MAIRIQLRRDTAANWTSANPVLLAGELGIETDTLLIKIGNGLNWNDITSYSNITPANLVSSLEDYILVSERGTANGVASLNSSTKVPNTQIDDTYFATVTSVTNAVNALDTSLSGDIANINTALGGVATDISDINIAAAALATTVSGHTTDITTLNSDKAPKASPTFTGDVVLPSTTTIGDVSPTEISYVNGVTSGIQSQIDSKVSTTSFNNHTGDTTEVHGIADTSLLVTTTGTETLSNKTLESPTVTVSAGVSFTFNPAFLDTDYYNNTGGTILNFYDDQPGYSDFYNYFISVGGSQYGLTTGPITITGVTSGGYISGTNTVNMAHMGNSVLITWPSIAYQSGATFSSPTIGWGGSTVTVSSTEISYLDGVTSNIQTQLDSKASSSDLSTHNSDTTSVHGIADTSKIVLMDALATTLDGDLTVSGDLVISGTTTTVNATDLVVTDPLIYIGEGNTGNAVDLGLVSSFNDGTYQHSGIARDASDGKWKFFKGVTDEPTTIINFAQGSLDDVAANNITAAGIVFTDGTQTKEGVPSRTPIISKTASYTLSSLSERDSMIEVNSTSGTTITIPTNAAVAFPIGASIDISQISSGQVTIAGDSGVTVNATPGLKLRTQWSTATLFKRGIDSWLVYGDLTA